MGLILAIFRLVVFAIIATSTALIIFFGRIFGLRDKFSFSVFDLAIRSVRFTLNIKAGYKGIVPKHQGVIMSNHRSYIDIVLIPSKVPYVIVAKKQVRSWPIIGIAAIALKVIFVNRDSVESRKKTRMAIKDRLQSGLSVLIFPEGTTHAGPAILPFKPGMFNTCAEEQFVVTPVAIEYRDQDMAWVGDDTFLAHFFRAFRRWKVEVAVSFGAPMSSANGSELRQKAETWVQMEAFALRNEWDEIKA